MSVNESTGGSLLGGVGNIQSSIRQFAARAGFVNGLHPKLVRNVWYVSGNTSSSLGVIGSDGNSGLSPLTPFLTMSRAFEFVKSFDVIVLMGVIREQLVTPADTYDVTIIGAGNNPRQATSGGVYTGGGASWLGPASPVATTPLLEVKSAGWAFKNLEFTPVNASAAVRLTRSAVTDSIDASHAAFDNCAFQSNGGTTQIGIEDNGGCGFVTIDDCRFEALAGTAIKGLNTAAAVPLRWKVRNNYFWRNTNAISMSSSQGLFERNRFNQTANDVNFKVNLVAVAAQGDLNYVIDNIFSDAAANVTIAKGYKPGTTDVWRNFVTDTAAYIVAVPV